MLERLPESLVPAEVVQILRAVTERTIKQDGGVGDMPYRSEEGWEGVDGKEEV